MKPNEKQKNKHVYSTYALFGIIFLYGILAASFAIFPSPPEGGIQYYDNGSLNASSNVFYNKTTGVLFINYTNTTAIELNGEVISNWDNLTPNLQQVTDQGATTTNEITINNDLLVSDSISIRQSPVYPYPRALKIFDDGVQFAARATFIGTSDTGYPALEFVTDGDVSRRTLIQHEGEGSNDYGLSIYTTNNKIVSESVRFAGNGNVGINTDNPQKTLDVNGTTTLQGKTSIGVDNAGNVYTPTELLEVVNGRLRVLGGSHGNAYTFSLGPTPSGPRIQLGTKNDEDKYFTLGAYGNVINFDTYTDLLFRQAGKEVVRITSSGNILFPMTPTTVGESSNITWDFYGTDIAQISNEITGSSTSKLVFKAGSTFSELLVLNNPTSQLNTNLELDGYLALGSNTITGLSSGDINASTIYYDTLTAKSPTFLCEQKTNWCKITLPHYQQELYVHFDKLFNPQEILLDDVSYTPQEFNKNICPINAKTQSVCDEIFTKSQKLKEKRVKEQNRVNYEKACEKRNGLLIDNVCYNIQQIRTNYAAAVKLVKIPVYESITINVTELNEKLEEVTVTEIKETNNIISYRDEYVFNDNCNWNVDLGYYCERKRKIII